MSTRSPMNARYQKHTKPKGSTRKSAASAKPSKPKSSSSTSSKSTEKAKPKGMPPLPPEAATWRKRSFWLLGIVFVVSGASLLLRQYPVLNTGLLVIAYALLAAFIYIDLIKVRPYRQAAMRGETYVPKGSKDSGKDTDGKDA